MSAPRGRKKVGDTVYARVKLFTLHNSFFKGDEFTIIAEHPGDHACGPTFTLRSADGQHEIEGVGRDEVSRSPQESVGTRRKVFRRNGRWVRG